MEKKVLEKDAADLDGSTVSFSHSLTDKNTEVTLLYVNDLDVSIDIDGLLSYTEDTGMDDAYVANEQSVSSGNTGADTLNRDVWGRIGADITPSSNPSTGTLTVYMLK